MQQLQQPPASKTFKSLSQVVGPLLHFKVAPELHEGSPIETTQTDGLVDKNEADFFLIYLSADWCPPCHRFTPLLIRFETHARVMGKGVKVGVWVLVEKVGNL